MNPFEDKKRRQSPKNRAEAYCFQLYDILKLALGFAGAGEEGAVGQSEEQFKMLRSFLDAYEKDRAPAMRRSAAIGRKRAKLNRWLKKQGMRPIV